MTRRGKRRVGAVAQVAVSSGGYDEIAAAKDCLIGELPHAGLAVGESAEDNKYNTRESKKPSGSHRRFKINFHFGPPSGYPKSANIP